MNLCPCRNILVVANEQHLEILRQGADAWNRWPRLIDGGRITIPNRASYDPEDGTWAENRGVVPDVEVEWWPADWRQGRDRPARQRGR